MDWTAIRINRNYIKQGLKSDEWTLLTPGSRVKRLIKTYNIIYVVAAEDTTEATEKHDVGQEFRTYAANEEFDVPDEQFENTTNIYAKCRATDENNQFLNMAAAVDKGNGFVGLPLNGHGLIPGDFITVTLSANYNGDYYVCPATTVNEIVIVAVYVAEIFKGTEIVSDRPGLEITEGAL